MQVIYLIRHGETEFNRDGRVQGYTESPLSDLGVEQARRLRARLEGLAVDAAYTSPLSRAQETCRIAMDGRGWEARAGLREIGLGEWEGKRAADLRREFPDQVKMWFRSPGQVRIPGAETMADFRRRVTGELDSIRAAHPDGTVVVIAHGGVNADRRHLAIQDPQLLVDPGAVPPGPRPHRHARRHLPPRRRAARAARSALPHAAVEPAPATSRFR